MKPIRQWDWGFIFAVLLCTSLIITYTMLVYSYGRVTGVIDANEQCSAAIKSLQLLENQLRPKE